MSEIVSVQIGQSLLPERWDLIGQPARPRIVDLSTWMCFRTKVDSKNSSETAINEQDALHSDQLVSFHPRIGKGRTQALMSFFEED